MLTLVPSLLVTGVLGGAIARGAFAASFAVSGREVKISAARIEGTGYATYPSAVTTANGGRHPVTVLAIKSGRVWGLCQSSVIPTPWGRYVLRLSSPAQGSPVRVERLMVSSSSLEADIDFSGLGLNRDAASLDAVPGATGSPGGYGLQAVQFAVREVRIRSWAVYSSSIRVTGLRLAIGRDESECF